VLTETSYLMAIYVYTGAAGILVLYVGWWLSRHWRPAWVCLVVLLLAALLLTPAYPGEGIGTMAPALVVLAFRFMSSGVQGASYALRPLLFMCGMAIILAVLLKLIFFRRRKPAKRKAPSSKSRPRAKPVARAR